MWKTHALLNLIIDGLALYRKHNMPKYSCNRMHSSSNVAKLLSLRRVAWYLAFREQMPLYNYICFGLLALQGRQLEYQWRQRLQVSQRFHLWTYRIDRLGNQLIPDWVSSVRKSCTTNADMVSSQALLASHRPYHIDSRWLDLPQQDHSLQRAVSYDHLVIWFSHHLPNTKLHYRRVLCLNFLSRVRQPVHQRQPINYDFLLYLWNCG